MEGDLENQAIYYFRSAADRNYFVELSLYSLISCYFLCS